VDLVSDFGKSGLVVHYISEMSNPFSEIDRLLRCHHTDDPAIVETMIEHCYAIVFGVAISILRDPDDAKDATQDTFLTVMTKLEQYEVGTNFRAWLYTIAVNTCRGYLRKRKAQANLKRLLMPLQAIAGRPPGPEASALRTETRYHLWAAVNELDERHRITVILRMGHGLSVREIAQVLGIREKTVYSRLYDAFRKLRHELDGLVEVESIADLQPTANQQ
jgi:RNA polymerase sigma-70 factor (ECF subfamily)